MANLRESILKPVPILSLRPTQMTVGMGAAWPPSDRNGRGYFGSRPIM
jgi:hypothetical protein